jgi:predicted metal-dependent hydrolase
MELDVVRKDIKHMHLAVYPPNGRIRISVPEHTSEEKIRLFVISKMGWIRKNREEINAQERIPKRKFVPHESHYFRGHRFLLRVKETQGKGYVKRAGQKYLDLYVKLNASQEYKQSIMEDWYRDQMRQVVPDMITEWEAKLGVQVRFWGIRKMKTKWGSCNTDTGRIWLNLELAKKPHRSLEYILVHEMVHLIERHHNETFRRLMEQHIPDWKDRKKELNELPVCLG